jgi:uncharacterized damage-inducible protein DinB
MIKNAIDQYAAGAAVPARWIRGLSRDDLLAVPIPGKWSIQQLVLHVLDSDLIASHRMKRIIAEDLPLLVSYDETAFASSLGYEHLDPAAACEMFRLNREQTAAILRGLPEGAFARAGIHTQRGKVRLAEMLGMYTDHLTHHAPFLIEKREKLGRPMA